MFKFQEWVIKYELNCLEWGFIHDIQIKMKTLIVKGRLYLFKKPCAKGSSACVWAVDDIKIGRISDSLLERKMQIDKYRIDFVV